MLENPSSRITRAGTQKTKEGGTLALNAFGETVRDLCIRHGMDEWSWQTKPDKASPQAGRERPRWEVRPKGQTKADQPRILAQERPQHPSYADFRDKGCPGAGRGRTGRAFALLSRGNGSGPAGCDVRGTPEDVRVATLKHWLKEFCSAVKREFLDAVKKGHCPLKALISERSKKGGRERKSANFPTP